MRYQGKITRWEDEKGFGFITCHEDGISIFVHIKAFSLKIRRPEVGDIVSYELAKDKSGRTRAEKVLFSGQSAPKVSSKPSSGIGPIVFTLLFALFLLFSALFNRVPWAILVAYGAASVVAFFAYGFDKSAARSGKWRTPESTLLLVGLACGWPGALAAQRLLRHKSSKSEFLRAYWITVIVNVTAVAYLAWRGEAGFVTELIMRLWENAV